MYEPPNLLVFRPLAFLQIRSCSFSDAHNVISLPGWSKSNELFGFLACLSRREGKGRASDAKGHDWIFLRTVLVLYCILQP